MRIKLILFLLYFVPAFSVLAVCKSKQLKCLSAESQSFVGGAAGSPSGTKYKFKFIAPANSKKVAIDQVWVGEDFFEVTAFKLVPGNASPNFEAKDTIIVEFTKLNSNPIQLNNQENAKPVVSPAKPLDMKGEALIGYKLGSKRKYLSIEKIEVLKRANYQ